MNAKIAQPMVSSKICPEDDLAEITTEIVHLAEAAATILTEETESAVARKSEVSKSRFGSGGTLSGSIAPST
jgi:hypothetical protein